MSRVKLLVFLVAAVAALFASGALLWRYFEPDSREQVEQAVSAGLQMEVEVGSLQPRIRGPLSDIQIDRPVGVTLTSDAVIRLRELRVLGGERDRRESLGPRRAAGGPGPLR